MAWLLDETSVCIEMDYGNVIVERMELMQLRKGLVDRSKMREMAKQAVSQPAEKPKVSQLTKTLDEEVAQVPLKAMVDIKESAFVNRYKPFFRDALWSASQ